MRSTAALFAFLLAFTLSLASCSKEDPVEQQNTLETPKADTPEEILIAVSGEYRVEKVTEHRDDYLFSFTDPSPIKLNREYPNGITSVSVNKVDVKEYSENGKNIFVVFADGRQVTLTYSAWLSVRFDATTLSFSEECAPVELPFRILDSSTDSVSIKVSGCEKFIRTETSMEPDRKNGKVIFCMLSERYFADSVSVCVSNGKKQVSQTVLLSRKDFKFSDGSLSLEYSFPEYERYFEIDMHCADTAVHITVPQECREWILTDIAHENVNDVEKTILCILLRENKGDTQRSGTFKVTNSEYDRELPVTINQIGSGMEGSLRKGLEDFYRSLKGDAWVRNDNWCSDKPFFEWYGISADNTTKKIRFGEDGYTYFGTDNAWVLNLSANNMRGIIPDSFWGVCEYFEYIRISREYLPDSTVPDCVWHDNLWKLDLSASFMNIPLSDAIGNAKRLKELNLQLCKVTGGIPEAITTLENLSEIYMSECSLTGTLPRNIGNLKNLEYLILDHNMELGGILPDSFYAMDNLREFDVSATRIGGTLTTDVSKLKRLEYINLDGCEFEGTIPEEFGLLSNLVSYEFHGNYFDSIPQFVRYIAYNSKTNGKYSGGGDWVGSGGFPLGVPYFQRKKSDGRPENYIVTVPDVFEFSEILVDGKPLKRPGYYVNYKKCRELPFPVWANIKYGLYTWERGYIAEMKYPEYPYADDLQYPAYQYYYDGKDWRHPSLEHPAREYVKEGDKWVHDQNCSWDAEYKDKGA